MPIFRKTAVVQFVLPSTKDEEKMPLTLEREYGVFLSIDGCQFSASTFRSPVNDERWRDFVNRMKRCNEERKGYESAVVIRAVGRDLFQTLAGLSPVLQEFLSEPSTSRRLVIQTTRPELHLLPWGALYDLSGKFLAARDLSVVQSWGKFSKIPVALGATLNLVSDVDANTTSATLKSLKNLPEEITRIARGAPDILHIEKHGNPELNQIGGVSATTNARRYAKARIALLWSCYSGSADSWGQSPALSLHRQGVPLVLSFQAPLNVVDAKSISRDFYSDVFGPAASRDPETALVRIRAAKFEQEFDCANWASMVVYMTGALDLSAMALNGPQVPQATWFSPAVPLAEPAVSVRARKGWKQLARAIERLPPGSITGMEIPDALQDEDWSQLPVSIVENWRGNKIRLDGGNDPLSGDAIAELNLPVQDAPKTDAADRLVWFFQKIASFGAPLIVWTDASPWHSEFLKTISPNPALTFLLIYGKPKPLTVPEFVDLNKLDEAQKLYEDIVGSDGTGECDDEVRSAAYFAYARCNRQAKAAACVLALKSSSERALLTGNYVSRWGGIPEEIAPSVPTTGTAAVATKGPRITDAKRREDDCYRETVHLAETDNMPRDSGRARHELGYFMQTRHRVRSAETFYRASLLDFERSPLPRDIRWHSALANLLRDWADLLADKPDHLDEALKLLRRALAIHAFHGRRLQIAYSLTTQARIHQTAGRPTEAVEGALDAANLFEECRNWGGWVEAIRILLDGLAEKRETGRMLGVVDLTLAKLAKVPGEQISDRRRDGFVRALTFENARAHWIHGDMPETRKALEDVFDKAPRDFDESALGQAAARLKRFVTL
ncbi:hypothetical protein [Granulicella sibirica]|uniref:CHAT domain-containing protein n=1 Tax=Granulicella sibirica TaxID=2479048 RepID=A0A4Q0T5N1_9BACT|nr:hypothetical protein [Granulicella sibirica]RXH58272.1 hypothetical protein GRAN_1582 [Granulicella sibirica]